MTYEEINNFLLQIRNETTHGGNTRLRIYEALKKLLEYVRNNSESTDAVSREYVEIDNSGDLHLKNATEVIVTKDLIAGDNIRVVIPDIKPNSMNWAILILSIGDSIPTIVLPENLIWKGESAPVLVPNTIYRFMFNLYEDSTLANTF